MSDDDLDELEEVREEAIAHAQTAVQHTLALRARNKRVNRMLDLAHEIVHLETVLAQKHAEFNRILGAREMAIGDRGRPTMRTRILEVMTEVRVYGSREIKQLMPEFSPSSLNIQFGRMVDEGLLERVRWGMYRKVPTPIAP